MAMRKIEPHTDNDLEWDGRRYVLTIAYIKDNFEVTYKDDGTLDARRKLNSKIVYKEMARRLNSNNVELAMKIFNETAEGRRFVKDVLSEQMQADLKNGYNDMGYMSPIDFAKGQAMDKKDIEANLLCPSAEGVIDDNPLYFPFNVFTAYAYPWNVRMAIMGCFR